MLGVKMCDFCLMFKPSAREITLINSVYISCRLCESKINIKECKICNIYKHVYDTNNICIYCIKCLKKIVMRKIL